MPVTIALCMTTSVFLTSMFILNGTAGSDAAIVVRKKISWKTFSRFLFVSGLFIFCFYFFHRSFCILWIYFHFQGYFASFFIQKLPEFFQ